MAYPGENTSQGVTIPETEVHHLLSNDRRRNVIKALQTRVGSMSLGDLAETIATVETGTSPPPRAVRNSVYNSLAQTHLPQLHEMGVVEYDGDRKTVALGERAGRVRLHMEVLSPYGITWAQYYRTLGLLALVTIIALESGVVEVPRRALVFTTVAFLGVIAVSTVYQIWPRRRTLLGRLIDRPGDRTG